MNFNKLPKFNRTNDNINSFETNSKLKGVKSTRGDDMVKVYNYFSIEDGEARPSKLLKYKKTNNIFNKIGTLKRSMLKKPQEILDEVKQKYDFYHRIKDVSKRDLDSLEEGRTEENFFTRLNNKKQKTNNKFKLSESKEIDSPVANNTLGSNLYSKIFNERKVSTLITDVKNKEKALNKTDLNHVMKVTEMSSLLSNNKYANENIWLKNSIEVFSSAFPNKYEKLEFYFRHNTSILNSENKIIQMFLVVLDIIINSLSELDVNNEIEINIKCISILDAIFVDFLKHLTLNSFHRADFMKKIWIQRIVYIENFVKKLKEKSEKQVNRGDKLEEENKILAETVMSQEKEIDDNKTSIRVLNKEVEKWCEAVIEKEVKEVEYIQQIEDMQKEYNELSNQYSALLLEFNNKLINNDLIYNSNINVNNFQQNIVIPDKKLEIIEEILVESQDMYISNLMFHKNGLSTRRRKVLHTQNSILDNEGQKDKSLSDNKSIVNLSQSQNTDIKDLVRSRKNRNSLQNTKNLKSKIAEKDKNEQRKSSILENNIYKLDRNIKEDVVNSIVNDKQMFQLYMNKGINFKRNSIRDNDTQTDIHSSHMNPLIKNNSVKDLEKASDSIMNNLETLNNIYKKFKSIDENKKAQNTIISIIEIENTNNTISEIKEIYSGFFDTLRTLTGQYDILLKENDLVNEKLSKSLDTLSNVNETYMEIFNLLFQCLKETNTDVVNFINSKHQTKIQNDAIELLKRLVKRQVQYSEREEMARIYKYLSKPELGFDLKNNPVSDNSDKSKNVNEFILERQFYYKSFQEVMSEFEVSRNKIKVNTNAKKIIKIINFAYFDMFEKIYFKKDKNSFDYNDDIFELPELLYIYFSQNFGLESQAKKKFLEFLQAMLMFESNSKRISIFSKMMQMHKNNSESDYDTFVIRKIILLIQMMINQNIIIKNGDENNSAIFLLQNKLYDLIMALLSKFSLNSKMKNKILSHIEKIKKNYTKNMFAYVIVDFDEFIEFFVEILVELKNIQSNSLRSIFNSVNIEPAEQIKLIDFVIINQYYFAKKINNYENMINTFKKQNTNKDVLSFEEFETICIEKDLFDINYLNEFVKIKDENVLIKIFKTLQEELRGSALSVFNDMNKRLQIINTNFYYNMLSSKIILMKQKITQDNINDPEEASLLWMTLKLFDAMSVDIYNDFQLMKVFKSLEPYYKILEEISEEKKQENFLITHLKQ